MSKNAIPNCPPGLEFLTRLEKIKCEQLIDWVEGLLLLTLIF